MTRLRFTANKMYCFICKVSCCSFWNSIYYNQTVAEVLGLTL